MQNGEPRIANEIRGANGRLGLGVSIPPARLAGLESLPMRELASALSTLQICVILHPQADGCFTSPHRWSNLIRRRSLPSTRGCGADSNL